jgi:hypothetical protein
MLSCLVVFRFVSFCLVLSCLVLSSLVCLLLSSIAWSGLVLCCLVLSDLVLSRLASPCLALPCIVWSGLVWSGLVWSSFIWSGLVWPCLVHCLCLRLRLLFRFCLVVLSFVSYHITSAKYVVVSFFSRQCWQTMILLRITSHDLLQEAMDAMMKMTEKLVKEAGGKKNFALILFLTMVLVVLIFLVLYT